MLRIIIILFALMSYAQSQNLETIISHALSTHNSLKAIEQRLKVVDDSIELTQHFTNPTLSLSVGDIQLDDLTNRSIEPMQFTSLTFQQKIPYFGKRAANASLAKAQKDVVYGSLEEAKVALVKEIKLTAYTIWEVKQKLQVVDKKIDLIKQSIELHTIYSSSGDSAMMDITTSKLRFLEFKIAKSKIKSTFDSLLKRLSYLSNQDITSVESHVDPKEPKTFDEYFSELQNNQSYKKELVKIKEKNSLVKVRDLASKIDPFVSVGYFYREAFADYVNITVGASLPIYGSESIESEQARKEVLQAQLQSSDLYEKLSSDLAVSYSNLQSSYEIYQIIATQSIPEIDHMLELSSTMLKNGKNLILFLNMQENKLSLEEKKYMAMASYKRYEAQIQALVGETK
ncbi:MAG: TolC family protein [Sulfurimonas sp.]|uniref:TolC family protein n=1 Tax=Sulfurimonas sp. TaxID=2022749 RepID=UPI002610E7C3|nr:TolC family protein [Sulfurimonas sp.]MCW8894624.1 TolC family protein [Sulfurimonas sp.]MCW8955069.1 TolC family protein [Sulfurimonas sp.]MCW9066811.1 TolC family protein [Sulfurimonas sp.]